MKKLLLLPLCAALSLPALLTSCGSGTTPATQPAAATPAAQAKAAEDSLMARHDRLMGQADQVIALAARLQATPKPPRPLLARLQNADQAMMTWMHQYQAPDSTAPAPQRLTYLQDQLAQLGTIGQQLTTSLDSAKALVKRLDEAALTAPATPAPAPKR